MRQPTLNVDSAMYELASPDKQKRKKKKEEAEHKHPLLSAS